MADDGGQYDRYKIVELKSGEVLRIDGLEGDVWMLEYKRTSATKNQIEDPHWIAVDPPEFDDDVTDNEPLPPGVIDRRQR